MSERAPSADSPAPKRRRKRTKPAWGQDVRSTECQRGLREQILFDTAARLFNKRGFHGTSMSHLTEALGLTKGALYYYVRDKSDLLYKLHLKSIEATRRSNQRAFAEGQNGYDRVRLLVRYYVEAVTTSHAETFILLEEGALNPDQLQDILTQRKALERDLRAQIVAGIEDGSISPGCNPKIASFAIVGAMAWVTSWYEPDGEMSAEEVAQTMSDLLARMVVAAPR